MSKIDAQKVIEHLKAKWQGRPCVMCGVGNWTVQDTAFEVRQFSQGGLVVGGPVIPVVPVVCTNCGNTVLVNAIISNAITPPTGGEKK